MKVYISPYRDHWLSPYTILEKICFWRVYDMDDPHIERWAERLEPICLWAQKVLDKIHPPIRYVKVDHYDTWSMDHTLSHIILPMLKQLKATQHGSAQVDPEDVPEHLRPTEPAGPNNGYTDNTVHERWAWVMDEMIFAFESRLDDSWQDAFRSGEIDHKMEPCKWDENGKPQLYKMVDGPNHTYKCDYDGMRVVEERIQNGFRLFGKYYQSLWD